VGPAAAAALPRVLSCRSNLLGAFSFITASTKSVAVEPSCTPICPGQACTSRERPSFRPSSLLCGRPSRRGRSCRRYQSRPSSTLEKRRCSLPCRECWWAAFVSGENGLHGTGWIRESLILFLLAKEETRVLDTGRGLPIYCSRCCPFKTRVIREPKLGKWFFCWPA